MLKPVESLMDLQNKAYSNKRYEQLAIKAAENLGSEANPSLYTAMQWLYTNAIETDEDGVVDEVNFCIDLIKTC